MNYLNVPTHLSFSLVYHGLMTSLTFYGGVNEIGGNKILLEDKDTRVFLDFGKGFSRRAKFFEEYINPRVCKWNRRLSYDGTFTRCPRNLSRRFDEDG